MPRDTKPVISSELCTRCGQCVEFCAPALLQMGEARAEATGPGPCYDCGHCIAVCPEGAISLPGADASQFIDLLPPDEAATAQQVEDLMRRRRSMRRYTDEQVPEETIGQLIRIGTLAPSGMNEQAWHFTVVRDPERLRLIREQTLNTIEKLLTMLGNRLTRSMMRMALGAETAKLLVESEPVLRRLVQSHASGKDCILWGAPTLIIVHSPRNDDIVAESSHYAVANMMAMATAMGLGTCLIGFVTEVAKRDPKLKEYLEAPMEHTVDAAMVVGYPEGGFLRSTHRREPPIKLV